MKTPHTFGELTVRFKAYLQLIGRQDRTVHRYAQLWARISIFMDTRHMKFYNRKVGEAYLAYLFGSTDYSKLTKYYQVIWNSVEALTEFQDSGTIIMGKRRNPPIVLEGPIGATMEDFVSYKRSAHQIGDRTTYNYRLYLNGFLTSLTNNGIQLFFMLEKVDYRLFKIRFKYSNTCSLSTIIVTSPLISETRAIIPVNKW